MKRCIEHISFPCFSYWIFTALLHWGYFTRLNWNWVRKWGKCVRRRIDITFFYTWTKSYTLRFIQMMFGSTSSSLKSLYCYVWNYSCKSFNFHSDSSIPLHQKPKEYLVQAKGKWKLCSLSNATKNGTWNSLVSLYINLWALMGIFCKRKHKNFFR